MKLLFQPLVWQLAGLGLLIGVALVLAIVLIRKMRKELMTERELLSENRRVESPSFATAALQGVIATLKQRETLLNSELQAQSGRIASLETMNHIVLENIPTGVLVFSLNLLVQHANRAARTLLGYASPLQMHARELFRGLQSAEMPSTTGAGDEIVLALGRVIGSGTEYRDSNASYLAPNGASCEFQITLLPILQNGHTSAALCLLSAADKAVTFSFPPSEPARVVSEAE